MDKVFDVAIIGGGINGCGCAADAALRGLSVILFEEDDLASKTSSKSTKLIHGGLRYLENYDFSLVKKALNERQKLLQLAPHLVHPLPLILPHQNAMRPLWVLRIGLLIYDYLCLANQLPHSVLVSRDKEPRYFTPLANMFNKGFLFYDGMTDDARLTITNALQAKEHGAVIMPHTKLLDAKVANQQWHLSVQTKTGACIQVNAKTVINTTGPWVEPVNKLLHIPMAYPMTLIKGSHLVVQKLYEGDYAYMLQSQDKRIVFTIPYHGYTLIGTTEVPFSGNPDDLCIDNDEIDYLLGLINQYFDTTLDKSNIITTWSGIRPLLSVADKTPRTLSRDYAYHYVKTPAPAVTVYGGKITTYRQLAIEAINALREIFPNLPDSLTDQTPLPGSTKNSMSFTEYKEYAHQQYAWLEKGILERYLNQYGTRTELVLSGCTTMASLGKCFMPTLYQVEVDYLINEEWASNSDDILWRRTKLGLHISNSSRKELEDYISTNHSIVI